MRIPRKLQVTYTRRTLNATLQLRRVTKSAVSFEHLNHLVTVTLSFFSSQQSCNLRRDYMDADLIRSTAAVTLVTRQIGVSQRSTSDSTRDEYKKTFNYKLHHVNRGVIPKRKNRSNRDSATLKFYALLRHRVSILQTALQHSLICRI